MNRSELRTLVRQYCPRLTTDKEIEERVHLIEDTPLAKCDYRVAQFVSDYLNKNCYNGNPLIGTAHWPGTLAELTRRVEFILDCDVLDVNAFMTKD